jgi:hypothetical protein
MVYNNYSYVVLNVSEVNSIDFSEVLDTAPDTLVHSLNGQKTFVKYLGTIPPSVLALTTKEGPYNHQTMLGILETFDWNEQKSFI